MAQGKVIDTRDSVFLSVTTQGSLRKELSTVISRLLIGWSGKVKLDVQMAEGKPYESVLNRCVQALVERGVDWWLHTDNDQVWAKDPLASMRHLKDVIVFPTPIFRPGGSMHPDQLFGFNTWELLTEREIKDLKLKEGDPVPDLKPLSRHTGLQRVDVFGTGSFLVRVSVLERLLALPELGEGRGIGPFTRTYDDHGVQAEGNDVAFCRRCREAGIEMWADFDCMCHHWHSLDMLDLIASVRASNALAIKRMASLDAGAVEDLKGAMDKTVDRKTDREKMQSGDTGGDAPCKIITDV
jgi:hypothetical protein